MPDPVIEPLDTSATSTHVQVWDTITSKYTTAGNWAIWAQNLLDGYLKELNTVFDSADYSVNMAALDTLYNELQSFVVSA